MRHALIAAFVGLGLALAGCGTDDGSDGAGAAAGSGGTAGIATCDPDPLAIGDAEKDQYDCLLIELTLLYGFPDPMLEKAQIEQESAFNPLATSSGSPCGIPDGWTDAESRSFGLLQLTPACGAVEDALLPDGYPNLTQDPQSELWPTSLFNPEMNLDQGVKVITEERDRFVERYPGCTEVEYNLMSLAAYNQGASAVLGCGQYEGGSEIRHMNAVLGHYREFADAAGWPNPYPETVGN